MSYGKRVKNRGFTLIEALIVVAIMGMLLLSLSKLTMDGIKVYKRGIIQTEMKNQIRKAMDAITSDLRQADVNYTSWVPDRTTDSVSPNGELEFRRYVYTGDNTAPTIAIVKYKLEVEPGNAGYYMLTREVTEGGVVRYGILAEGLKYTANSESASHFKWKTDGMDTSKADVNSLLVVLVMEKYSGNVREEIKVQTAVAIRSDTQNNPETASGSSPNYAAKYGVFMDTPSSLVDPREDY